MGQKARLLSITNVNNNKYYYMDEDAGGSTFTAKYGRVDVTETTVSYPMSQWNKKFNEKIRKGYVDRTDLLLVKDEPVKIAGLADLAYSPISNSSVQSFINKLLAYANKTIEENYKVSGAQVTQAQLVAAQAVINALVKLERKVSVTTTEVNDVLLELYSIIPRQMGNVRNYLVTNKKEIPRYISSEQTLLDTMEGEYKLYQTKLDNQQKLADTAKNKSQYTILQAHNLDANVVEDGKVIDKILKLMGDIKNKFVCAYAVNNFKTDKAFNDYVQTLHTPNTKLLWHGSRNENWWSITTSGLLIKPSNAIHNGSMFGAANYHADKAKKSLGYTSYKNSYWARGSAAIAYLAIYNVALGNPMEILQHKSEYYNLNAKKLKASGFDSVFAKGGADLRNNEYMTYTKEANTIQYIIEVK